MEWIRCFIRAGLALVLVTFVGCTDPPTLNIDSPADGSTVLSGIVKVVFKASGGTGTQSFTCQLDSNTAKPCASGDSFRQVSDGNHTITVTGNWTNGAKVVTLVRTTSFRVMATTNPYVWSEVLFSTATEECITLKFEALVPTGYAGEGNFTYECSVNGGTRRRCVSPQQFCGLTDGSQNVSFRAHDGSDPNEIYGSHGFFFDAPPPGDADPVIVKIISPAHGSTFTTNPIADIQLELSEWIDLAARECQLDGGPWGPCPTSSSPLFVLNGQHILSVRVTDSASNVAVASSTFTMNAPVATITQPADGSVMPTNQFEVQFSSAAGTTTDCSWDGVNFWPCTPANWSGFANQEYTFWVRSTDVDGRIGLARTRFRVDAPAVTITAPTSSTALVNGCVQLNFVPYLPGTYTGSTNLNYRCANNYGPLESCTSGQQICGLTSGYQQFVVHAYDPSGSFVAAGSTFVYVGSVPDVEAPVVTIISPAQGGEYTSSLSTAFNVSEYVASMQCRFDGEAFGPCNSPRALSNGNHTFSMRVEDYAQNITTRGTSFHVQ